MTTEDEQILDQVAWDNENSLTKKDFDRMANWFQYHANKQYTFSLLYGDITNFYDVVRVLKKVSMGGFERQLNMYNDHQRWLHQRIKCEDGD